MAASMSLTQVLLLVGLVVAAFSCVAAEGASFSNGPTAAGLDVKVALQLNLNKCYNDVRVLVGVKAKGAVCAAGAVTVLQPVATKLEVPHLLYVELEILGNVVVKTSLVIDLRKVTLLGDVYNVVLDVVEDVKTKQLLVLCLGVKLKVLDLLKLGLIIPL